MTDEQKRTARPLPIMIKELRDATRDGSKTQTRRVVTPQPRNNQHGTTRWLNEDGSWSFGNHIEGPMEVRTCPHGKVGDICYLREPLWKDIRVDYSGPPREVIYADTPEFAVDHTGKYVRCTTIDGKNVSREGSQHNLDNNKHWSKGTWTAMTMPRWASRCWVEITDIRVERLQDITNEDAIAEGIGQWQIGLPLRPQEAGSGVQAAALALGLLNYWDDKPAGSKQRWLDGGSADAAGVKNWLCGNGCFPKVMEHKHVFALLWDAISIKRKGKPHYPWSSNPWTWVVKWELCK